MSTATPSTEAVPVAPATTQTGYSLGRAEGKCSVCARALAVGEKFTAAVRETAVGLERLDIGAECWAAYDKAPLLAYWQATLPTATAPKEIAFSLSSSVRS